MKEKVSINDRSIESAGIPKDYKEALSELIWNGFDAGATRIEIEFDSNEIEYVNQLIVRDNGSGIDIRTLPQTFGTLLDSLKNVSYQRSSYTRGQKGKGRFSFTTFARRATWSTVFNPDGQPFEYSITIQSSHKDEYEITDERKAKPGTATGTEVILSNLFGVTSSSFTSDSFFEFLCQEFGWFLFLNRKNNFSIQINGEELNYSHIIAEYDVKALILDDGDEKAFSFDLTYIRWKARIGDRYYYYFLNQKKRECAKQLTSFNNNAIEWHHSLYIESDFFNDFGLDEEDPGSRLIGKNQSHPVFRNLVKELHHFLSEKEKRFIQNEAASKLVREYEVLGIMPPFRNNAYDQARHDKLEAMIRELYALEPKIFKGLRREQQKVMIGMLNLTLESSERDRVLEIVEKVTQLKEEDRHKLVGMLGPDEFSETSESLKLIQQRYDTVALLQYLCESEELFVSEKERIRDLISGNTWLLGEQYHLTSAEKNWESFLIESLTILDGKKKATKSDKKNKKPKDLTRPDLFLGRKRIIPDPDLGPFGKEENLLIEVKRPGYGLGQTDHRQAEAYLRYVIKDAQFNGAGQAWKFFLIGNSVDKYIRDQYKSYKNKGRPYLIQSIRNYEIYALSWKDLFNNFFHSHSFMLGKQPIDRGTLELILMEKGIKL